MIYFQLFLNKYFIIVFFINLIFVVNTEVIPTTITSTTTTEESGGVPGDTASKKKQDFVPYINSIFCASHRGCIHRSLTQINRKPIYNYNFVRFAEANPTTTSTITTEDSGGGVPAASASKKDVGRVRAKELEQISKNPVFCANKLDTLFFKYRRGFRAFIFGIFVCVNTLIWYSYL